MNPAKVPPFVSVQLDGALLTVEVDINLQKLQAMAPRALRNSSGKATQGAVTVKYSSMQVTQTVRQFIESFGITYDEFLGELDRQKEEGEPGGGPLSRSGRFRRMADEPKYRMYLAPDYLQEIVCNIKGRRKESPVGNT